MAATRGRFAFLQHSFISHCPLPFFEFNNKIWQLSALSQECIGGFQMYTVGFALANDRNICIWNRLKVRYFRFDEIRF